MNFSIIILLLVAHWFGDFVFQSSEMAIHKNRSLGHLFHHISLYSFIMFITVSVYHVFTLGSQVPMVDLLYFWLITFITHAIVDFFSSKMTHKLYKEKTYYTELPNFGFFTVIGLDQLIHFIILFSTYKFLFL